MKVKIDYTVSGIDKYISGILEREDDLFFYIKSRDNLEYRVPKKSVVQFREVKGDSSATSEN